MGIHLPFVGYAKAWGHQTVRFDQTAGENKKHVGKLEAVFAALRRAPPSYFEGVIVGRSGLPKPKDFTDILFETHADRPLLQAFKAKPSPKSLVIPNYNDLFSRTAIEDFSQDDVDVANDVAKDAFYGFIPIICLDDKQYPISPETISDAGEHLRLLIMNNECHVRNTLDARLAQLQRLRAEAQSEAK